MSAVARDGLRVFEYFEFASDLLRGFAMMSRVITLRRRARGTMTRGIAGIAMLALAVLLLAGVACCAAHAGHDAPPTLDACSGVLAATFVIVVSLSAPVLTGYLPSLVPVPVAGLRLDIPDQPPRA